MENQNKLKKDISSLISYKLLLLLKNVKLLNKKYSFEHL